MDTYIEGNACYLTLCPGEIPLALVALMTHFLEQPQHLIVAQYSSFTVYSAQSHHHHQLLNQ